VKEERTLQATPSEIVENLRLGTGIKPVAGFELHENNRLDDHVGAKHAGDSASEIH
jgi:hypothetical protein